METGTKIETVYPLDPDDLKTFYANHINVQNLPEEVYLDFCNIQPQAADPKEVRPDGTVAKVPATAVARVIISREHAKRLASVLSQSLLVRPEGTQR